MLYPNFNDLVALKDRKLDFFLPSCRSIKSMVHGNHSSSFRGQGLEFDSVREYVLGDDIRNIDWRVTARTGSPHLKLFKENRERQILIAIDMNSTMRFGTKKTFKSVQAARIAAILGWRGLDAQDPVSSCLFGDISSGIYFTEPKSTRKSFYSILKLLCEPQSEQHRISLESALQPLSQTASSGALVYLISDFMDINQGLEQNPSMSRLRKKCDVVFISVNDQADKTLYPVGVIGFLANLKERMMINTNDRNGREVYAAQWKENRQSLYQATSKLRIPLIEMTTESDVGSELFLGFKKMSKRKGR